MIRERSHRELGLAVAFVVLWVVLPLWPLATLRAVNVQDDIYASDLWNDRLPTRAFVGASLRRGELPVWMPGIYTGFPSLAQVEVGAAYPTNLLLFGVLPPYAAVAWAQLLPLIIAGVGAYALAGALGIAFEARLLAAGTFATCGFLVAHLRQLNMVDAAAWVPLLLAATEWIVARSSRRAPLLLAIAWALQLLAGHPQISYYSGLVLAAYLGARCLVARSAAPLFPFAAAIAAGTLLAAVQLVPAFELSRLTYREGGLSFADATRYAASPLTLWTLFVPDLFGDAATDSFRLSGLHWEQYGYVGFVTPLLAIAGLVARRRDPRVVTLGAAGVLSALLMLGPNTPLFGILHVAVPGMHYFRFPTRFLLFVDLALVVLAAVGLDAVLGAVRGRTSRMALAAALIVFTAADVWTHQLRQVPLVDRDRWTAPIDSERILAAALARDPAPARIFTLDAPLLHAQAYHQAHGWSGDLEPYVRLRALLQPSFHLLFGLESPDGYSNLVPRHYEAVWGSEKVPGLVPRRHVESGELEPELAKLLRLFNVRYVLSALPIRSADLRLVAASSEGVGVLEVRDPLPRAFVVGRTVAVDSEGDALRVLAGAEFDPTTSAIVEGTHAALPSDAAPSREVQIVRRTNTEVVLHAHLEHPGLLVLSEGDYPGWGAAVDGADATIVRANVMMRAVSVPAGDHEIVFRFRSTAIAAGALLSLLALISLPLLPRLAIKPA